MEMIKKVFSSFGSVLLETLAPMIYFIKILPGYIGMFCEVLLPYVMYFLGIYLYQERNGLYIGGELILPVFIFLLINILNTIANRNNKGKRVPIPHKRFTSVDEYGEVSIENARIQELLLYTADLEDWLERRGLL